MSAAPRAMDEVSRVLADLIEGGFRERGWRVVGVSGAQGSGKSTAAAAIARLLAGRGLKVAAFSLDDLYLTRAERLRLAAEVHPLLAVRGPPGTHDIELGLELIDGLFGAEPIRIPSFDKARDDRRPLAEWKVVQAPVDIVILEGWCVGARPQNPDALRDPVNALEAEEDADGVWRQFVNDALAGYQALFSKIDGLILLAAPSFEIVPEWRREQEKTLKATARDGSDAPAKFMSKAEIDHFVQHFERLTREMLSEMPARADVVVELDEGRWCKGLTVRAEPD